MSKPLRLLSYLDEVSSVSLQMYNLQIHDFVSQQPPLHLLSEDFLLSSMKSEWLSSPATKPHWDYVISPVPAAPSQPGGHDTGHESWKAEVDFLNHPTSVEAGLTFQDIIALRLYTGKVCSFVPLPPSSSSVLLRPQ